MIRGVAALALALGFLIGCGGGDRALDPRVLQLSRLAFLAGDGGPALLVGRFEVTREEFASFLSVTDYRGEGPGFLFDWERAGAGLSFPQELESHPVVFVSRRDAQAFAAWKGMRLPSAREWERLACGRSDPRSDPDIIGVSSRVLYPWGRAWQPLYANTLELGLGKTAPVGTFESGRSEIGCYDVAGNVWEWIAEESDASLGVAKGGAFDHAREKAQCYESLDLGPEQRSSDLGFRCVVEFQPAVLRALAGLRPGDRDRAALLHIARQWGAGCAPPLESMEAMASLDRELLRDMRQAALGR